MRQRTKHAAAEETGDQPAQAFLLMLKDQTTITRERLVRAVARQRDRYFFAREPLDRAQYADMQIWLPGDILTKTDRMSMAVSLEAREPLLDYRLIEFAASLPASMRVKRGTGKAIMKQAMERYLPHDILYRPKMGFVTPVSAWFRGPLVEQAKGLATSSTLARSGWFDMAEIERIVAAHQSGRRDHGRLIWQFFMLEKSLAKLFGI